MAIPEAQLETWSHQGATVTSESTNGSIKTALESSNSKIKNKNTDIYLQGSYKNSTNIRFDW